jgi:hypothetical protein
LWFKYSRAVTVVCASHAWEVLRRECDRPAGRLLRQRTWKETLAPAKFSTSGTSHKRVMRGQSITEKLASKSRPIRFVVFDLSLALLAQVLFLLLALAIGGATLLFPSSTSSGDFQLQFLIASGVILDELIERRSGNVYLMRALQLFAF